MDFVMVANAWSAVEDNPTSKHQIALQLAAKGHRVLWIEGSGMRSPNVRSGSDRRRILRKLGSAMMPPRRVVTAPGGGAVWKLSPLFLPLPAYGLIRRLNGLLCCGAGTVWSSFLGMKDPTLILYPPVFAVALRLWPAKTLYHCVDRWDAFSTYDAGLMRQLDEDCCKSANLVVASARELLERCLTYTPGAKLVMHGVDWAHFNQAVTLRTQPRPADLPVGPIVGFFGLLSEWVDQDLLVDIARGIGEGTVVLIGKADVDVSRLKTVSNILLLGPKPFSDLPRYAAFFDVGLIPFHVNELTRSVNPIKLREMLAAGCPVVSTALPEVEACQRDMDDSVSIVRNNLECVEAVKRQLRQQGDQARRVAISAHAKSETWSAKVDELLTLLNGVNV